MNLFSYLLDPANWSGAQSITQRLLEHLAYSGAALLVAFLIALPIGILVGHSRRGDWFISGLSNATRAIPTLGLLVLVVTLLGTGALPVVLCLVILAIPPILSGTVTGFKTAGEETVLAARAMGMTPGQIVGKVELPLAFPLIVSGVRSAALQVIATATVAAMAASGGLGRLVIDGHSLGDYAQMLAGAVLVMAPAIVVDVLLELIAAGLRRRTHLPATTSSAN